MGLNRFDPGCCCGGCEIWTDDFNRDDSPSPGVDSPGQLTVYSGNWAIVGETLKSYSSDGIVVFENSKSDVDGIFIEVFFSDESEPIDLIFDYWDLNNFHFYRFFPTVQLLSDNRSTPSDYVYKRQLWRVENGTEIQIGEILDTSGDPQPVVGGTFRVPFCYTNTHVSGDSLGSRIERLNPNEFNCGLRGRGTYSWVYTAIIDQTDVFLSTLSTECKPCEPKCSSGLVRSLEVDLTINFHSGECNNAWFLRRVWNFARAPYFGAYQACHFWCEAYPESEEGGACFNVWWMDIWLVYDPNTSSQKIVLTVTHGGRLGPIVGDPLDPSDYPEIPTEFFTPISLWGMRVGTDTHVWVYDSGNQEMINEYPIGRDHANDPVEFALRRVHEGMDGSTPTTQLLGSQYDAIVRWKPPFVERTQTCIVDVCSCQPAGIVIPTLLVTFSNMQSFLTNNPCDCSKLDGTYLLRYLWNDQQKEDLGLNWVSGCIWVGSFQSPLDVFCNQPCWRLLFATMEKAIFTKHTNLSDPQADVITTFEAWSYRIRPYWDQIMAGCENGLPGELPIGMYVPVDPGFYPPTNDSAPCQAWGDSLLTFENNLVVPNGSFRIPDTGCSFQSWWWGMEPDETVSSIEILGWSGGSDPAR